MILIFCWLFQQKGKKKTSLKQGFYLLTYVALSDNTLIHNMCYPSSLNKAMNKLCFVDVVTWTEVAISTFLLVITLRLKIFFSQYVAFIKWRWRQLDISSVLSKDEREVAIMLDSLLFIIQLSWLLPCYSNSIPFFFQFTR